jgi:hypothetical protein
MSGCVNCVWERFREETDEWAAANAEAQRRLAGGWAEGVEDGGVGGEGHGQQQEARPKKSDGGAGVDEEALYRDIPVGIRAFMQHEKRLKERMERQQQEAEQRHGA